MAALTTHRRLQKSQLEPYQWKGIEWIVNKPKCGLFLDMGLGKTATSLTGIDELNKDFGYCRCLVIAPLKVAEFTWEDEIRTWEHLKHMTISKVLGSKKERIKALERSADVHIINVDNVSWLVSHYNGGTTWPFDMVVIDESSCFKNPKSNRFVDLCTVLPRIHRMVLLTGTPAPNGLLDLWAQVYLLDRGERLEEKFGAYRNRYFKKVNDYVQFSPYTVFRDKDENVGEGAVERKIYGKISDLCMSMKAEDYIKLPDLIERDYRIVFSEANRKAYKDFERESVLELAEKAAEEGKVITAVNAAALNTKLFQYASGAVYDEDRIAHKVHAEKMNALSEIIESANGQPVIIFYWFQHELERLRRAYDKSGLRVLKTEQDKNDWNAGKIPILAIHPRSGGHGLNLQFGGNIIVWFSLPNWGLELYQQAIKRLHRRGQKRKNVIVHRLIVDGTIDVDMSTSISKKEKGQNALMRAIKARVDKYLPGNRLRTQGSIREVVEELEEWLQ